jgi:hypothetical protein
MILYEVMADLNVLHLVVLSRIMSNLDGTFIIAQKRHFVTMDIVIISSLPHPKKLCTTTSGRHILGFGGGERETILLIGRRTHQGPTKKLASPRG